MYKVPSNLNEYSYKNIENIEDKNVIIRACINVAIDEEGNMTEPTRYEEALPLIKEMALSSKSLIVMGHLGRPTERTESLSLKNNVFKALSTDMQADGYSVVLCEELDDIPAERAEKTVYLLDNIRFFKGEESKDSEERMNFAKELATLADIFINDAFPDYKEAASTYDIAKLLPSYIGPVFLKEVEALGKFNNPNKPFVAILGGAKLSEKLDALNALGEIADKIIIGGAMAYTIMKAQGISIGKSLVEEDKLEVAKEAIAKYGEKLVLPSDHVVTAEFSKESEVNTTDSNQVPEGMIAVDIGPKTIQSYKGAIVTAGSILWNGPMGVFEWPQTETGTKEVGNTIISNTNAFKLAGGGDSIAAINKFELNGFDHISTGGGAMLAFLAYDKFPILDVIVNK